jgi:hypothetical protein
MSATQNGILHTFLLKKNAMLVRDELGEGVRSIVNEKKIPTDANKQAKI